MNRLSFPITTLLRRELIPLGKHNNSLSCSTIRAPCIIFQRQKFQYSTDSNAKQDQQSGSKDRFNDNTKDSNDTKNGTFNSKTQNGIIGFYNKNLAEHPLATKMITAAVLMGGGDVAAQKLDKEHDFDWVRFLRMLSIATFYSAPVLHVYFKILDRVFPGTSKQTIMKKLFVDQICFAPFSLGGFLAILGFTENGIEGVKHKFQKDYFPTMMGNYVLWPAANLINFKFIPPEQRILYVSCVGFVWNIFFSFMANSDHSEEKNINHA